MIRKLLFCFLLSSYALAQFATSVPNEFDPDDLEIGGDIFNDFNEDLETEQILEDESFYAYGRFFSLNLGIGLTNFNGNRGSAYNDKPPTFSLSINSFTSFQVSYILGIAHSKHTMFYGNLNSLDGFDDTKSPVGRIDVSQLRVFVGFRYYVDTSDLNTAITYSNPYTTMRLEYWYTTNKFTDRVDIEDETGGGVGMGLGGGLEFPITLKETYINFEFLAHFVNFYDQATRAYAPVNDDLSGVGFSYIVNYVIGW